MRVLLRVCTNIQKRSTRKIPKLATPLTDIQPRTAKPRGKPYKLTDGGGLHLLVKPDGGKYWRMWRDYAQIWFARKYAAARCQAFGMGSCIG